MVKISAFYSQKKNAKKKPKMTASQQLAFFRAFLATDEGKLIGEVLTHTHYARLWTDKDSEVYGRILAPLGTADRIFLYQALQVLATRIINAVGDEECCDALTEVTTAFEKVLVDDARRRKEYNDGKPWEGASLRIFGDIADIRRTMLGF
jgi:hypothetical protein